MLRYKLFKNAKWVITNDCRQGDIAGGSVLVEGNKIAAVGAHVEEPEDCEVIDATNMIVAPGFVDSHCHMWQGALRGLVADGTLNTYFAVVRQGAAERFEAEDSYIGSFATAVELINGGTTSVLDHSHAMVTPEHSDATAEAFLASGMRGVLCYGYMPIRDNSKAFPDHQSRIADAHRIKDKYFSSEDSRIHMGIALTEQGLLPLELTVNEVKSALDMNAKWTSHTACAADHGIFSKGVQILESMGLVNHLAVLSHCNDFRRYEFIKMREEGAFFASSPDSENALGITSPLNLIDAFYSGVNISIGTDCVSCVNGDMFHAMSAAMNHGRTQINAPLSQGESIVVDQILKARTVYKWATIDSARALGIKHLVGSLEPGKLADIIMLDAQNPSLLGMNDPVGTIVLCGHPGCVDSVMIDGEFKKKNGKLLGFDYAKFVNEVEKSRDHMVTDELKRRTGRADETSRWTEKSREVTGTK